ncbi:DUF559 domain-containing protein [Desertihabitans brevis]|nr:DUF559 domain-containing protein [Desertihabitans brevis]
MKRSHHEIWSLLAAGEGVLLRADCPELGGALDWLARSGRLLKVLPGTYVDAARADDVALRVRAARRWAPDAVFRAETAARLTFWPEAPVTDVALSVRTRQIRAAPGFRVDRRHVPPDLVQEWGGLRCTTPALTALDLCPSLGGAGIDSLLRSRRGTLDQLWEALAATGSRPGNVERTRLLIESRDQPWSEAERVAHVLLRSAGIGGWVANHPVRVAGHWYYLDIAFPERHLAIEVDGREHHGSDRFEADRWRHNELTAARWTVLHITWSMLTESPEAVLWLVTTTLGTC